MRNSRVGSVLLALGLLVGVVASIGLIIGFEPARLPPALLNIAAYKLTFLAAAGLLAAGAIVNRYARRSSTSDFAASAPNRPKELMEGPVSLDPTVARKQSGKLWSEAPKQED